jgi:hypothetical protein
MPLKNQEQLAQKTARLRKKLEEKGPKMDERAVRGLKKKIRRAQRRRRVLVATAARRAGAGKEKKEG